MTALPGKNWSVWSKKYSYTLISPPEASSVSRFVNDKDMRELNQQYRQIDRATDVLSFPQKSEATPDLLGDIVISYQTAVRHSRRLEITVEEELRLLVVHAVLSPARVRSQKEKAKRGDARKRKRSA